MGAIQLSNKRGPPVNRYRWYRAGLPITFDELLRRIEHKNADKTFGVTFRRIDQVKGEFSFLCYWKSTIFRTTFDRNGAPVRQPVENLASIEFSIFQKNNFAWIRTIDPPRSIRPFLNALELAAGFGFFLEPVSLPNDIGSELDQWFETWQTISLKGTGSILERRVVIRFELGSKDGLDPENMSILQGIDFTADQATVEVIYKRERGQLTFGSLGTVRIIGGLAPRILEFAQDVICAQARS